MAIVEGFPSVSGVVDALELGKDMAGLIIRDTSGNPRAGVFPRHINALVTSRVDMKVDVAAFEGVCVRGGGVIFMANDGTSQVTIAAAPVSNSRIDVIYFKQNKSTSPESDGNNTALLDVVAGTAAASPVKPAIPAGATELATVLVPSGVSATNAGGVVITQTFQYTTTSGGTLLFRTFSDFPAATSYVEGTHARDVATDTEYVTSGTTWLVAGYIDTAWASPTLLASWINFGAPYRTAQYRRNAGVVHVTGLIKSGTITSGTTIFVLPAGFRPSATLMLPTEASNVYAQLSVDASGNVKCENVGSAGSLSVHFSFYAEA